MADTDDNFFSRWSRRKVLVREGVPVAPVPEAPPPLPASATVAAPTAVAAPAALAEATRPAEMTGEAQPPAAPPLPTLADVAELTTQSDYTRFVAQGVAPEVKNAALKKLFTDPHFNVMDGLDIYIDDYGIPDPLPEGMLRKMVQSKMLRLFDDDPEEAPAATAAAPDTATAAPDDAAPDTATPELKTPDEDLAVQLQPDPAAGRPGPEQGAGEDAGRQH